MENNYKRKVGRDGLYGEIPETIQHKHDKNDVAI